MCDIKLKEDGISKDDGTPSKDVAKNQDEQQTAPGEQAAAESLPVPDQNETN